MRILLIEDDRMLSALLSKVLEENHYALDLVEDGQAGLERAMAEEYDLILLDVRVPKLDGIRLCRELRSLPYTHPILLMTASNSDADLMAGFEAGADDYLIKPFKLEVLLARMRTLLRRSAARKSTPLSWGNLCLEPDSSRVAISDQSIALTATEYNLLELFLRNPNRIFSRSAILDKLWGFDHAPTDRAIITHIKDLRKKLKAGGLNEDLLETIYGMGYRLKPAPKQPRLERNLGRFRDAVNGQVATLEKALLAKDLTIELKQATKNAAHKLAGSLATLGYLEGSNIARSLEHLLSGKTLDRARCSELVVALRQVLTKAPVTQAASAPTIRSAQVLVIDNDQALTEQLQQESKAWGIQMQVVTNLTDARLHLASSTPDVVLLDLSCSDTTEEGLTLLNEIAQNLPVIVFTGRDSLADRLAVSRSGARQFLHKPATAEQLFRAIAAVLPTPQPSEAKVLIVDDDPVMLALLSEMLTPWGLEIVTLNDPQQFWDVLVAIAPNLVLLDLEMPGINGLELCQVVRQDAQWGDLPILVVTAHTDADSLQQAFAIGADDFIAKPVLEPALVTRVLSRIERSRKAQR